MRNINLTQSRIKLYFSHFDEKKKKKNKLYIDRLCYSISRDKKGGTHKATSNKIFVKIESTRESQIVSGYIGLCSSRDTLYFVDVPRARSFDPQRAEVGGRVAPPSLPHRWRKREENGGGNARVGAPMRVNCIARNEGLSNARAASCLQNESVVFHHQSLNAIREKYS